MLKKDSRKSNADPPDVNADDPDGTMERFASGLTRVLRFNPKPKTRQRRRVTKRQRKTC